MEEPEKQRIEMRPIGLLRTPFERPKGAPIQPSGARGVKGRAIIEAEFEAGLKDLDGFSHLILVYWFHLSQGFELRVTPFLDHEPRGLFATRAPRRPNPIGLSTVRLTRVEGPVLHLEDVDMVDKSPLLDLKPYVPEFDLRGEVRLGWLAGRTDRAGEVRADDRFQPLKR